MKKIFTAFILVFYILTTLLLVSFYSSSSFNNMIVSKMKPIYITKWNKEKSVHDEELMIQNIAKKEHINLFKIYYSSLNGNKNIDIYSAIGNKSTFYKLFNLSNTINLNNLNGDKFIGSIKNNNEIGNIDLLSSSKIKLFNISSDTSIPLTGRYYIDGSTANINKLFNSIGLIIDNDIGILPLRTNIINLNSIVALLLVLGIIFITYGHYLINTSKEYAIKIMSGYSKIDILKSYLWLILKTNIIAIVLVSSINIIYLMLRYKSGIINFIFYYLGITSLLAIGIIVILSLISLFIFRFNIAYALKNKKAFTWIQRINLVFKYASLLLIIILFTQLFYVFHLKYESLKNMSFWVGTNKYSYTDIGGPESEGIKAMSTFNDKAQVFVDNINSKSFLMSPSWGLVAVIDIGTGYTVLSKTSLNMGNSVFVNSNYLKRNSIYYSNGEKVMFKSNFGNKLIVLVPEMYKSDLNKIQASYEKWYQWRRYSNIYMNQRADGDVNAIRPNDYPSVNVDIKFIKNNQKTILYNLQMAYSLNSCIAILDGENIGADTYANLLERGTYYIPNRYNNKLMMDAARKSGLEKNLLQAPTLYSKISGNIYNLEKKSK